MIGVDKRYYSEGFKKVLKQRFQKTIFWRFLPKKKFFKKKNNGKKFDIITIFRPECYNSEKKLIQLYKELHGLLEPDGFLFALTYWSEEITVRAGFIDVNAGKNKFDPEELSYGCYLSCKKKKIMGLPGFEPGSRGPEPRILNQVRLQALSYNIFVMKIIKNVW